MELNKILIIRLSSIGDIILSTPLIRALRKKFPGAILHFAVKKQFADLVKYNPHINEVIIVDTADMEEARKKIREARYDYIFNIQKSARASQLIRGLPAPVSTYSKQRWARFFLIHFKWNLYKEIKPVYQRYFEAAEKWGLKDDGQGTEVFFSPTEEKKVDGLINGAFNSPDLPLVVLCPGASFANKRWTKEGFIAAATKLQTTQPVNIAVLGGPGEEAICEEVKAGIPGAVNWGGKLDLLESAALFKRSSVVVANDSGMMHLAQSQQTPVVAIFGPTVKEFGFFPLENKSTFIQTHISCRPCTKMGKEHCPKGHHKCMKDISPDLVTDAMTKFI